MLKEDNVLAVWKPQMMSSGEVLDKIKSQFKFKKIGHCGTLDPFAEGLLIVVTGSETSNSDRYMNSLKTYKTVVRLGSETDTLDSTGLVVKRDELSQKKITKKKINEVLLKFIGDVYQRPPSFSAKRINGVRLYKLARKDVFVKLKPIKIFIQSIDLISIDADKLTLKVVCGKGTYIRQLGCDIARELGTLGYLESLSRTRVGEYEQKDTLDLKDIQDWNCIHQ
tara:strand:+ start:1062 stop:1733 length:672 start_codon:yes stop_codon:yes gene_type:complete